MAVHRWPLILVLLLSSTTVSAEEVPKDQVPTMAEAGETGPEHQAENAVTPTSETQLGQNQQQEQAQPAEPDGVPADEPAQTDPPVDETDPLDGPSLLDSLDDVMAKGDQGWNLPEGSDRPTYPYVEHDGYFRFRADLFYQAYLGLARNAGTNGVTFASGMLPPITQNKPNSSDTSPLDDDAKDDNTIAGANIRFRYSPTIHIADWLRVKGTFDVLDNIVLGSNPDYANLRPDSPLVLFSGSQASPSDGRNALVDAIRVKEAYGEFRAIFGSVRFGRMASHWGLGILANGGTALDSDFGDYVDRVMLVTRLYGIYIAVAWDFVGEGVLAQNPDNFMGQALDATQADDVIEVVAAVFQRPLTTEELDTRNKMVNEKMKPAFDWGTYFVFRQQEYDLASNRQPSYAPTSSAGAVNTVTTTNFDKFDLVPRKAWAVIPDLWAKLEWVPTYGQRLRIELEASFIYGEAESVADDPAAAITSDKTIMQWGGVLQAEYQLNNLTLQLETGVASGDSAEHFGVLDQTTFYEEKVVNGQTQTRPNKEITNFKFDRNYYVDLLMFREAIGAVTNAVYVKPSVSYDLFDSVDDALGGRLDIITAFALEPEATPGNEAWYGIEFDAQLFYEEKNRFRADLSWGTFLPGGAFDLVTELTGATKTVDAKDFAMTIQGRLFLMF